MATIIFLLCTVTSFLCALKLWQSWRKSGHRLIFWTSLCFAFLTMNNALLVLDEVVLAARYDFRMWRLALGLIAFSVLVYGLVAEEE
ncbi:MAG: DUF5985 family protein [Ramlibacter sp.]